MNKYQLERILEDEGIPSYLYNLYDTGRHDERLCLEKTKNGMWQVYFSERGRKTSVVEFNSEDEACKYILKELKKIRKY